MVVGRRSITFTPCPPSPARSAADPATDGYIHTWLADLAALYPDLQADLPGYSKALCGLGYKTLASLAFMHPDFSGDAVAEVQKALKINVVLAKVIVAEALALHPRARSRSRSGSAARNIHERTGAVWESKDLLELLEKRANEWLLLPPSGRQVAAAAEPSTGHVANCHKWMGGDCTKPDCIFKHDPAVKGRSDLIPTCNLIRQKGACDRLAIVLLVRSTIRSRVQKLPASWLHNSHNSLLW